MQQELKVIDAHNLLLKLSIVFVFLLIFQNVYAQNDAFAFQKNFINKFNYPKELRNNCIPTYTDLVIELSENGTVTDIAVSDSAPQLFKGQFELIKSKLNLNLLKSVIVANKLKNCDILIPIFYVFEAGYCGNAIEPVKEINDKYYMFKGQPLNKLTYNLTPIIVTMLKPRE